MNIWTYIKRGSVSLVCATGACVSDGGDIFVEPKLVGSDFCKIGEKLTWSLEDTAPTIRGIRRHNAKYDRRCLAGRGTS